MTAKQIAIGVVAAGILVVVMFVLFGPIRYDVRYLSTLFSAPEEVRAMLFVEETDRGSTLVEIALGGLKTHVLSGVRVLSLAHSGGVRLAVVEQISSGAVDVVRIQGRSLQPLTTDGRYKTGVTLSPDGTRFAYSALRDDVDPRTFDEQSYDVTNYETRVYTLSGEEVGTFDGNHPYFWSNDTLVFFSERGIETRNLLTDSYTYVTDSISPYIEKRPSFGRNNTMIVHTATSSELTVLEFTPEPPLVYRVLNPIPGSDTGVGLSAGHTMYLVTRRDGYGLVQGFTDLEQAPTTLLKLPSTFFNPSDVIFAYDN